MHSLGIMMSITALLTLNVIAYTSLYDCTSYSGSTVTTGGFLNSIAGQKCGTPDILHIIMMIIAVLYVVLSIVFLSVMACKLGECGHRSTYNQVYPSIDTSRTQPMYQMPPQSNRMVYY